MKKILGLVLVSLFLVSSVSYAVDLGAVKMNGDFRFRFTNSEAAGVNDSMTVPRARIKLSGNITDDLSVVLQPDFSGLSTGGNVTMADFYADLKCKEFNMEKKLRFGQFLVPFAYDSGKYLTIIYPSHYNVICPDRDFGFGAMSNVMDSDVFVSLTNGDRSGADNNKAKDIAARVIKQTPVGEVGLSGYYGRVGAAQTEQKAAGAYLKTMLSDVNLLAEYVVGGAWTGAGKLSNMYLQASKRIDDLEPLIQYEVYDANTAAAGNAVNTLMIGVNKYLADNGSRFMINYNIIGEETGSVANNTLIAQLRVKI